MIKITKDGFVWKTIDRALAKEMFRYIDVYVLHLDNSETLIESDLDFPIEHHELFGIEVGKLKDLKKQYKLLKNNL